MSATTKCPECRSDLPIPYLRGGRGEVAMRCRVCRNMLSVQRPPEVNVEAEADEAVGKAFNLRGYELLGVLGRGGMGMVFSAVRHSDREIVAIKILPPECWRYPELLERFEMEAFMMASLDHPNIVPILDRGQWNEYPYIVMDYVPGCTLKHRIEAAAPLPIDEVVAICVPVSEAIQACHDRGLVHRDLKPGNVLLSQSGTVTVTDFGIANLLMRLGHNTDHGVMIGTPQYIAPEQMQDGSAVGIRADQYSLAVIIYEMLTRSLPMGMFDPPSKFCEDLTKEAEAAIMKALSHDEDGRYESMRHFMRAFRRALDRKSGISSTDIIKHTATAAKCHGDLPTPGPSIRVAILGEQGNVLREENQPSSLVGTLTFEHFFDDDSTPVAPDNDSPAESSPNASSRRSTSERVKLEKIQEPKLLENDEAEEQESDELQESPQRQSNLPARLKLMMGLVGFLLLILLLVLVLK